jgi:hypothetical protein
MSELDELEMDLTPPDIGTCEGYTITSNSILPEKNVLCFIIFFSQMY